MCDVFCKQFKGWCKSFTKTEVYLSVAQGVLLAGFIAFLTFLILHFIACHKKDVEQYAISDDSTELIQTPKLSTEGSLPQNEDAQSSKTTSRYFSTLTIFSKQTLPQNEAEDGSQSSNASFSTSTTFTNQTLPENVECTWDPSHKTEAVTHYYYKTSKKITTKHIELAFTNTTNKILHKEDLFVSEGDGLTETERTNFVLALVKIKPPQDVVFGCILTVLNTFWTITAASCIESIEEVDSLDSFVMMERFGEKHGPIHAVSDVMIHPLYQGNNRSYDLAVIKSEDRLNDTNIAKLPSILDYLLITLGENLDILGFGRFRNIDKNPLSRTVHSVTVNIMPLKQCETGDESWALRHLVPEGEVVREGCGAGRLCAGLREGRSTPCNYCAGSPLLRGGVLLGVMSDNRHCGLACEPNLYVNVAELRDWIDSVIKVLVE